MSINNNTPSIRFSGFGGDWVEKKLGDIANFSKGSGYSKSDLRSSGHPIILYGRLYTKYQTVISEVDTFVNESKNSVKSQGNEVVVPASGETAEDIARASAVKQKGIILGGDLNVVGLSDAYNSVFTALKISNGQSKSALSKKAQGKSVVHIRNSDLQSLLLNFPNLEEQTTIGNFFQHIDETIALSRSKHKKTKTLKKSFLNKMFPQAGKSQPEIRLQGFSGDWVDKQLGDLSTVQMCKRIFKHETKENGQIPFYKIGTFGGVADAYIETALYEDYKKKYPYPQASDILISASGTIGRLIIYSGENAYYQDSNIIWLNIDKLQLVNSFLFCFYQTVKWNKIEGSTIKRLYNSDILSTSIKIPKIEEQAAIGQFFKQLDNTITLQAKQLKALENLKKALLAKMFV